VFFEPRVINPKPRAAGVLSYEIPVTENHAIEIGYPPLSHILQVNLSEILTGKYFNGSRLISRQFA
jgi:hypothetical protein